MNFKRIIQLLAVLYLISNLFPASPFSTALAATPTAITNSDGTTTGTIGQGCVWTLSADRKTLTLDGGTLPDYEGPLQLFDESPITKAIKQQLHLSSIYISKLVLKGAIKTGSNAAYLFSNFSEIDGLNRLNTSQTQNMAFMFYGDVSDTIDTSSFNTSHVTNMSYMFGYASIKALNLANFDTSKVTDMSYMFGSNSMLESLDISSFDTRNVANMEGLFLGTDSLTDLDISSFNTANVTNMAKMFDASGLEKIDVSKFDTRKVTDMLSMFSYTQLKTLDLSSFNTAQVTEMTYMLSHNHKLQTLLFNPDLFQTRSATSTARMFEDDDELRHLDVSHFDTRNVTDMRYMFDDTSQLTSLDVSHFNTSKVTSMLNMFSGDDHLQQLDVSHFDTHLVEDFGYMFSGDSSLKQLDVSKFDTHLAITNPYDKNDTTVGLYRMFADDTALTSLDLSNFVMTQSPAQSLYTYTAQLFENDTHLDHLRLGPGVLFQTAPMWGGDSSPKLPTLIANNRYTGKWAANGQNAYTSDQLIARYSGNDRPKGIQTFTWQLVDHGTQPPIKPTLPPTTSPTNPEAPLFVGSSINAVRTLGLYRQPTFRKQNHLLWYHRAPRTRQPQFVVTGKANSKNGIPRYKVRDVNHHSNTYGRTGYVTTKSAYVQPTYYAKTTQARTITVINPKGINGYRQKALTNAAKHYRQGQQLKVKRLVTHNLTTRFQLTNGTYITANKQLVQTGRRAYPYHVTTTHAINRYRDVNLHKRTRHYAAKTTLTVHGWDYSDHGTLRYRIAGGYITANPRYVR